MPDNSNIVLVSTHPRSGTHLCINALCLNVREMRFSFIRRQYPTLERLLLDHDDAYTREFEAYLRGGSETKIVKTHLRPSEIRLALEQKELLAGDDLRLFREIADRARRVHVFRDGRDVMLSWFHYMKDLGLGLPSDLPPRIAHLTFPDFLRMPNKYLPIVRGFAPEDGTRPRYWAAHADEWAADGAVPVSFESLRRDFSASIRGLAAALGMEDRLIEPLEPPPLVPAVRNPVARAVRLLRRYVIASHYRSRGVRHVPPLSAYAQRGAVGGWRAHYAAEDKAFFLEEAETTLRRLGYKD